MLSSFPNVSDILIWELIQKCLFDVIHNIHYWFILVNKILNIEVLDKGHIQIAITSVLEHLERFP